MGLNLLTERLQGASDASSMQHVLRNTAPGAAGRPLTVDDDGWKRANRQRPRPLGHCRVMYVEDVDLTG